MMAARVLTVFLGTAIWMATFPARLTT